MQDPNDNAQVGTFVKVDEHLNLSHVVGQEEAVSKLTGLVNRIKYADIYHLWAVDKPKAIALTGPPGCGKTFSIRALANEVSCPLMELCYEDLASHLYDESIRRLAAFKEQVEDIARVHGHVLILIDEADSFFQSRFDTSTHPSDKKKTNFFLRWIDGDLEGSDNFTIIATSNAWETVDPALRRSGRFYEVKYEALAPEDVKKALSVHMQLAELRVDRKLFEPSDLDGLDIPEEITGADVKDIVSDVLIKKAEDFLEAYLEQENEEDLPDLTGDLALINVDELEEIINKRLAQLGKTVRKVGFGS